MVIRVYSLPTLAQASGSPGLWKLIDAIAKAQFQVWRESPLIPCELLLIFFFINLVHWLPLEIPY